MSCIIPMFKEKDKWIIEKKNYKTEIEGYHLKIPSYCKEGRHPRISE